MEAPKTLDEILALEDIDQEIAYLKKGRRTSQPDTGKNLADWSPKPHDIMRPEIYPEIKVLIKMRDVKFGPETGKSVRTPAKYEMKEPDHITLPIEQGVVNIHTAFTVGMEPSLDCQPEDDKERGMFKSVRQIFKKDKLRYQNRKIVRSQLSEQEVTEYWYMVKDDSFWTKLKRKIASVFGKTLPEYRLKSQIRSPFKGDKLYPFYGSNDDMVAFSRECKAKDLDGSTHPVLTTITDTMVFQWNMGRTWEANTERMSKHGFKKISVIYTFRSEALCKKIKPQRGRLEKTLNSYADYLDNRYFPMLILFGNIRPDLITGDARNRTMNLTGDGVNTQYLTQNQSSDPVKVEIEICFNQIYDLTNMPRVSFDQPKGIGNALSGTTFRYVFMTAHMAMQNRTEELGSFFQRCVNFLTSTIGVLSTSLEEASHTVDIETEIVPFMIDNESDKVTTAVAAVSGGV